MTPRAIVLASSKGGVSKTTVTAALAVRATQDSGKVAMIDLDPQQALARWWELRQEPMNPHLFRGSDEGNIVGDVEILKGKGWEYIFIDTPPALMGIIESAIMAADAVIIPVRASPIDLESIDPAVELCEAHDKPFAFLLTHYDKGWRLSKTAAAELEDRGKVLTETVSYRAAYVGAMIAGRTGPEYSDKAAAKIAAGEIDAIWAAVKRLAKTARLVKTE